MMSRQIQSGVIVCWVKQHAVFGITFVRVPIHPRQQSRIISVDKETNTTFTTNELSPNPKEQIHINGKETKFSFYLNEHRTRLCSL
jgi:hypothetical protein